MGKNIRLLFISPHFAEYTLRLANGLLDNDVKFEVKFCLDRNNFAIEIGPELAGDYANVKKIFFTTLWRPKRYFAYFKIIWICMIFRPQVIHIQESGNPLAPDLMPILARLSKVVLTIHDPLPHLGAAGAASARTWRRRLQARRAASLVFAHDKACAKMLASPEAGALRQIVETRHGVLFVPRPQDVAPPDPTRILFFGRMEAYKGLEVLLDAAELLASQGVVFKLVVAGKGPELDRLRPRIAKSHYIVTDDRWLSPVDVIREFQQASIVVLPYLEATQSGVAAGAFGNGRPVIASAVGGLPDIVVPGENGLLVPPGDPASLAEAIRGLLNDQAELRRLMDGAASTGRTKLDWREIGYDLIQTYRQFGLL